MDLYGTTGAAFRSLSTIDEGLSDTIGREEEVGWMRVMPRGGAIGGDDLLSLGNKAIEACGGIDGCTIAGTLADVRLPDGTGQLVFQRRGIEKSMALQVLCDRLGLRPSQFAAFGDGDNDIGMLTWAGRGVAPSNATPETKAKAAVVSALSHDNDFIAHELRAMGMLGGGGEREGEGGRCRL